ncbi:sigma-70 family RNA polymerase sigma factor [Sulfurimonas sp.]|uniref:sigma-70 family RNA polymerase sigma factor n=1 Tax=Sulfurimonas sp. TaxID=2022749 RepID=UPI003D09942C
MKNTDASDFATIYEQLKKPLLRFIRYKVTDPHIAEEILNDVFFKAYNSIESLEEKKSLKSWLYTIASNSIIDFYRKKTPTFLELEDEKMLDEKELDSIYKDFDCCLKDFLNRLSPPSAQALQAVYFDEMTQQEYAEKNSLNLSTVKSYVFRGKKSLKELFEQCCEFERDQYYNIVDFQQK